MPEEMIKMIELRDVIYRKFNEIGFTYVTMDLMGYRSGSMNEVLSLAEMIKSGEEQRKKQVQ